MGLGVQVGLGVGVGVGVEVGRGISASTGVSVGATFGVAVNGEADAVGRGTGVASERNGGGVAAAAGTSLFTA